MSRIGRMPIPIPAGVKVSVTRAEVSVEGQAGQTRAGGGPRTWRCAWPTGSAWWPAATTASVPSPCTGSYRRLVQNMVTGVTRASRKVLLVNGVGYRAELKGKSLLLSLGFSNPIEYAVPEGIKVGGGGQQPHHRQLQRPAAPWARCARRSARAPARALQGQGHQVRDESSSRRKIGKTGVK